MQMCVAQFPAVILEVHRFVTFQQAHDEVEALFQQFAGFGLLDADHRGIGRQRTRPHAQHDAAAREVIEQHDALRNPQRMVIAHADHAGAELDVLGAFRGSGDEDFRGSDDFHPGRVVLADPRLVVAQVIEMLDECQIALQGQRGVGAGGVERREENAEAHSIGHGDLR